MARENLVERKFSIGRQSEALYNDELYKLYESVQTLLELPDERVDGPKPLIDGGLYLDRKKNELKQYDAESDQWVNIFSSKFQITDRLLEDLPSDNPVKGQLWLNQDVLMYFTGTSWKPVKTILEDSDMLNLAIFEDFLIMSPVNPQGDAVLDEDSNPTSKVQFLTPHTGIGRFYIDRKYSEDFTAINRVTAQYDKKIIADRKASWVHVNSGKLTSIKKRMFIIDKHSHFIEMDYGNTEFYGYKKNSPYGSFLMRDADYIERPDGILLQESVAFEFDYILAITYKFGWVKSSGHLTKTNMREKNVYSVQGVREGINVFIEGYNLDNTEFEYSPTGKTIEILDTDMKRDLEVSVIAEVEMEYGVVRAELTHGRGLIKLRKKYQNPLIFVNGEALHAGSDSNELQFTDNNDRVYIRGARKEMSYCIMDTVDRDGNDMMVRSGQVENIVDGNAAIEIPDGDYTEEFILFIDGLLVKKEDIKITEKDGKRYVYVTTDEERTAAGDFSDLTLGERFILLDDPNGHFQHEDNIKLAIKAERVDESLVFVNGGLLCNETAISSIENEDSAYKDAYNRQVLAFKTGDNTYEYKFKSSYDEKWIPCDPVDTQNIVGIVSSYQNSIRSVILNLPVTEDDELSCYVYNFANTLEHPVVVGKIEAIRKNELTGEVENDSLDEGFDEFSTGQNFYTKGENSLAVYVDGVRQYEVEEYSEGNKFKLPEKVSGVVNYIIERPEDGSYKTCNREILGPENLIKGANNVYQCDISLYPGSVTVYVDGLRQPKDSYSIVDNHTIMFKESGTRFVGSIDNWPDEDILNVQGKPDTIHRTVPDRILIEVRTTQFRTEENFITTEESDGYEIPLDKFFLPRSIVDCEDTILFYVDGMFSGLRLNEEYEINRDRNSIIIDDERFKSIITTDPMYKEIVLDIDKYIRWKEVTGKDEYKKKLDHLVTLEWR